VSIDVYLRMNLDTGGQEPFKVTVHESNITHNVVPMWDLAGCYDALYMADGKLASEIVDALDAGVRHMEANREAHEALNPSNGWGKYEHALSFLREYASACRAHPKATVVVSK
jgi:hypothetical protein